MQRKDVRLGELQTESTHSPSPEGEEGTGDDEAGHIVDSIGDTSANDDEDDEGDRGTGTPVEVADEELASRCEPHRIISVSPSSASDVIIAR